MRVEEDFKVIDHYLCICMPKEVDHHNAGAITQHADEMICKREVKNLIFDFSETEFMDSSGIGVVIGRSKAMHFHEGVVFVMNVGKRVDTIFKSAGLYKIVSVREV